jgi:NDP-sugar pyrophosphorylase family protein
VLESDILPALAGAGELTAFEHHGCWYCMDTPADVNRLNRIAETAGGSGYPWLAA